MTDISTLLASYPRGRPPLPAAATHIYVEEYKLNRGVNARGLYRVVASLESWMHRRVASAAPGSTQLEIGAGTLNHRHFEERASVYDIVEPLPALYAGSPEIARVDHIYASIHDVPAAARYDRIFSVAVLEHVEDLPALVAACAARYDRIFSVAVLEHVEDLPALVAACALLLAEGGVFQAGIPAEGGMVWGLAWRVTTGVSYRLRTGLPYAPVMRHEHLNSAVEIIGVLRHLFEDLRIKWFPLPARHFAFYAYIEARRPNFDRCAQAVR